MKKNKYYFHFLFIILFISGLQFNSALSQNKIKIVLMQPPPNQLSVGTVWKMSLENLTDSTLNIYLVGTVDKDNIKVVDGTSATINLPPGKSNYNYRSFETGSVNWHDNTLKEFILRTGNVPAGKFETCIQAFSSNNNIPLSTNTCINIPITRGPTAEITLISPPDGEAAEIGIDVVVIWPIFSWSSPNSKGRYNIVIKELKEGQTREQAMNENKDFFIKKNLRLTSYQYGAADPKMEEGKDYVWCIGLNDVWSQIWVYRPRPFPGSLDSIIKGEFCGQMIGYEKRIREDAEFREGIERLEKLTREYKEKIDNDENESFRKSLIIIPVVVHVLYKFAVDNVSDAQIQSQIDALNIDFRKLNLDASTIPAAFQSVATDAFIEFRLAQRDPNCNLTNGITRTPTSVTQFIYDPYGSTAQQRNPVKFNITGGKDGWPSDKYLNMWVCKHPKLANSAAGNVLMGYGSFPSQLSSHPSEDGVVLNNISFGTMGTVIPQFNKGRIAAHEIGHWLNLRHIWGDDIEDPNNPTNDCLGDDLVYDTPNQAGFNINNPTSPIISCSNGLNGDMFMNHMDYTLDASRTMFTSGQSDVMNATLFIVRYGLLGSQGAIPPGPATEDLWMKDTYDDVGDEPNIISNTMWISDDIWIRNSNDGLLHQEHQNPDGDADVNVYVRVRNRGCATSSTATLKLYWAKASTGVSWPAPWDGSVVSPLIMGNVVGTQSIGPIAGNDFAIYHFNWHTPKPSDYDNIIPDISHFCLIARIETVPSGTYGMTSPETTAFWENVKNNNNIVWKNIHINDLDGGFVAVTVTNFTKVKVNSSLKFDFESNAKNNINVKTDEILKQGEFEVKFDKELFESIRKNGDSNIVGLEYISGTSYRIVSLNAEIKKLQFNPGVIHYASIKFTANKNALEQRKLISLNLIQKDNNNKIIGGQNYKFVVKDKYNSRVNINENDERRNPINFWDIPLELTKISNWSILSSTNCAEYDQMETITHGDDIPIPNGWLWSSNDGMYYFSVAEQNALIADAKLWANNNTPNCSNGLKKSIVSITFYTTMIPSTNNPGYFIGCHVKYGCCTNLFKPEDHD